ncbi:MAG TPA: chemotaxis protein CheW [Holophaga sp.]|nr:chemotaxis protein CheW [Holophaga sp.]
MVESTQLNTRASGPPVRREAEAARSQFLTFSLGAEVLAMDIRLVKEILQYSGITEVPLTPPDIRGVINLRGAVVPVVDLAVRFGRPVMPADKKTCIVILEVGEEGAASVIGVMVDHVSEVIELGLGDIEPPPTFGNTLRADFVRGVGKIGGKFVLILAMDRILALEELAKDAESGA